MYNITFQQIGAFLTAANCLNLSHAADKLYVSQPTLSKTLQRFESGIGSQVFNRSNKGLTLTEQGEYLYGTLGTLLDSMDKAIKTAREMLREPEKRLSIVVPSSYDSVDDYETIKKVVVEYCEMYPDVVIQEQLCDFQALRHKLEFREVDIAITHDFASSDMTGLQSRQICPYRMHLALSSRHPLATYNMPPPEKLAEYTYFAVPHTNISGAMDSIIAKCGKLGFEPKRIVFVDNFPTLLHMLRNKLGVSICAKFRSIASDETENDLKYYPLTELRGSHVIVAWYEEKMTNEMRNFIQLLR